MSESKVRIDDFTKTLSAELDEYAKEVQDTLDHEVEDILKEGKKKIREISPDGDRTRKKYRNDWITQVNKTTSGINGQIGNRQYRLTHLLEDGHLTPNKVTRTKPQEHVKPTQEWVEEELMNRLESKL